MTIWPGALIVQISAARLAADILTLALVEADDSRHRARPRLAGGGHQLATGAQQANGIVERERAGPLRARGTRRASDGGDKGRAFE